METKQNYQERAQFILKKALDHSPDLDKKIDSFYSDLMKKQQPEQHKQISSKHTMPFEIDEVFHMGSLSNEVYRVNLKNGTTIIVKHYSDVLKEVLMRDVEHQILDIMTSKKQYPFVFYKDQFCRVQAFIPGSSISRQQLNTKLLRKIIQTLATFTIKFKDVKLNPLKKDLRQINKAWNVYWDIYKIKLAQNPQLVSKVQNYVLGILDNKQIFNNVRKMVQNHKMVINHNDSNLSNILVLNHIQSQNPQIQLLDYQFANLNYLGYDLGNLLNQIATDYGGAYGVDELGKQHKFEIRKDWEISEYNVKQMTNLFFDTIEGNQKSTQEQRCRFVKMGRMISHLFWLFVGLKQIDDPNIDLNMTYYIRRRNQQFMKLYQELIKNM